MTSNRIRPPALLAKIAATVDVVSRGRLEFGIGVGSRTDIPWARREYDAYGLPYHDAADAVGSLAEACTVIRRLWTEDKPFDFHGELLDLTGAFCNPKPVQRPGPPIVIGGQATADAAGGRRARRRVELPRRRRRGRARARRGA